MTELNIVTLGATQLVKGVPVVQASSAITDGAEDVTPYGGIEMFAALGISAMPAPANDAGQAQGVVVENIGGPNATCVGAIDRRNADIYGNLTPGDTVLHATGPGAVSQVMCKAAKKQVVLATKGSDSKQILVVLDGKNDVLQITAFGQLFELSKKNGITLTNGQAAIRMDGSTLQFVGDIVFNQGANAGMAIMLGPKTGSPGSLATPPMIPLLGVST